MQLSSVLDRMIRGEYDSVWSHNNARANRTKPSRSFAGQDNHGGGANAGNEFGIGRIVLSEGSTGK